MTSDQVVIIHGHEQIKIVFFAYLWTFKLGSFKLALLIFESFQKKLSKIRSTFIFLYRFASNKARNKKIWIQLDNTFSPIVP